MKSGARRSEDIWRVGFKESEGEPMTRADRKGETIKGHKIFITGGAGFIGTRLCEVLVADNQIVVYDNGHRNALKDTSFANHPNLRFVPGDVLEAESVKKAIKGCDLVIHMAAIAGIDSVVKEPLITMKVNLMGTENVLQASLDKGIGRFLYFSTSEVYGPLVYKASEEEETTQGPVGEMRWTYAVSKIAAEHLANCYQKKYQLPVVIIRPFNVYGPRQVGEGAMHKFIASAIQNQEIEIYGDGTQIRSWCFVDDFVEGVLACLRGPSAVGEVFNLGDPKQTITLLALADKVIHLAGSRSEIRFKKRTMPDVHVRVPSIEKARKFLGYSPKVTLEQGIMKTIAWYQAALEKSACASS